VIYASSSMSGYGNAVVVDHGEGISTLYAHLSAYEVNGGPVEQGQILGYVGCTGHCYGDHLHFEVRLNGDPVDPAGYLP
jgi:murein DD-endopeptidase MepM/ murein hydrolase activator NlpD